MVNNLVVDNGASEWASSKEFENGVQRIFDKAVEEASCSESKKKKRWNVGQQYSSKLK